MKPAKTAPAIQVFEGTCPTCELDQEMSAITFCNFRQSLGAEVPLLFIGKDTGQIHLHGIVITTFDTLTWRGFFGMKTTALRWALWRRWMPSWRHDHE